MSQCSDILAVLVDGRQHSVAEIHQRAGFSRLNSRIADLRKRGHVITCDHVPGETGPKAYLYRLHESAESDGAHPPQPPSPPQFEAVTDSAEQLSFSSSAPDSESPTPLSRRAA